MGRGSEKVGKSSMGFSTEERKAIRWGWEKQGKESFYLFLNVAKLEHIYRFKKQETQEKERLQDKE